MDFKKEIPICYCGGDTVLINKNFSVICENEEYNISNATVEKCNTCGDMFIQERTLKLVESIIGYYPYGFEKQIFQFFD
ncbi:hypothetical protein ABC382_00065 [Lysinibacillus sp. 1P01SD]|uniref:hypothetical protein n=1 Tax=Lysinibacillus sp. 1P01SD TaxID=3132285 RepID=UPI0039A09717